MKRPSSDLKEAVQKRDLAAVRSEIDNLRPADIANLISDATKHDERALMFRCLPRKLATETFEYLPQAEQTELLKSLADEEVAEILNQMADDERTKLLEELPSSATKKLLELLTDEERERV